MSADASLLYQENVKLLLNIWDWRHRVMRFAFTGIGGLVAVVGWLIERSDAIGPLHLLIAVPLLMGSLLAFVARQLHRRLTTVMKGLYAVGAAAEPTLFPENPGSFAVLADDAVIDGTPPTLSLTLDRTYYWLVILLLASAVLADVVVILKLAGA